MNRITYFLLILLILTGCSSELNTANAELTSNNKELNEEIKALTNKNNKLSGEINSFKEKNKSLEQKLSSLEKELDELKNGPATMLSKAHLAIKGGELDSARSTLETLIKKYPHAKEINQAQSILSQVKEDIKKQEEAEKLAEQKSEEERQRRIAEATQNLRQKRDEVEGMTWYYDSATPEYDDTNNLHLYIGKKDSGQKWLRFRIRYAADEWLFIDKYQFKVDEETYYLDANDIERDNGYGGIWEWNDTPYTQEVETLVKAIINSDKTIIRHIGDQYHDDRVITENEKQALQRVVDAFGAL